MVNVPGLAGAAPAGRCLVMGVVNVTPDSFSDGGAWYGTEPAVRHGLELAAQGADEPANELCLARAQFSVKGDTITRRKRPRQVAGDRVRFCHARADVIFAGHD